MPIDTYTYVRQAVGWFGWLDTPLSGPVMAGALLTLGSFLLLGLVASTGAITRAMVVVGMSVFLVPLVVAEFRYPYFQGRYYLPLAVGGFFLAGRALASVNMSRRLGNGLVGMLGILWTVVQISAVVINVKRY